MCNKNLLGVVVLAVVIVIFCLGEFAMFFFRLFCFRLFVYCGGYKKVFGDLQKELEIDTVHVSLKD